MSKPDVPADCVAQGECDVPHASRKPRKWCRGIVGREHVYHWVDVTTTPQERARQFPRLAQKSQCQDCGKVEWFKKRHYCGACGHVWPSAPVIDTMASRWRWPRSGPRDYTKVPSFYQRKTFAGRGYTEIFLVCPGCGEVEQRGRMSYGDILPEQEYR